ncbi:MAG: hypothetical protein K2J74_07580 [Muribaculaceae bacterium]|nr:hypothetical protein [Muribaculaceae bacterium]
MDNYLPFILAIGFMIIGFVSESVKAKKLKNPNTPANAKPVQQQQTPQRPARKPVPAPQRAPKPTVVRGGVIPVPTSNPLKVPASDPIPVPESNPLKVPDSSPVKFLDGEVVKPIKFDNGEPIDIKIPEMQMAQEVDPYAIDHHDFSKEYDWKKAIIASEILKTKF